MSLEEPDIATAGTGDHPDSGRPREQRVALLLSTVLLVILTAVSIAVITWGPDRTFRERTTAAERADRNDAEVAGTSIVDPTTPSTPAGSALAPVPTAPAGPVPNAGPNNPLTPASAPAPAPVAPGVPVVSMGPAGPGSCAASWTVTDGGAAIIEYLVTHESEAAPPGPGGVDIGAALWVERTTATTATVDAGGTIRVSAHNAIGDGPTSEARRCD